METMPPFQHVAGRMVKRSWEDLSDRVGHLLRIFDTAPARSQVLWAFIVLVCLGAVGAYVWYMTFGHVVVVTAALALAWGFLGRWRWGFVSFLVLAGSVWTLRADNSLVAAALTLVSLVLGSLLALAPPDPDTGPLTGDASRPTALQQETPPKAMT